MMTVVTLGTGSGKPTPERNVAATAVFRQGELLLFDCGEGTQMQLTRANLRPGALSVVCISHFHGDHINGLPGLLGTLQLNQRTDPLVLIGPRGIGQYVSVLSRLGAIGLGYKLNIIEVDEAGVVFETEDYAIAADRLKHRITSWGYRLAERDRPGRFDLARAEALQIPKGPLYGKLQKGETVTLADGRTITPDLVVGASRPGLALAYCCDTSPCDGAIRLAASVDVLVHEGTYAPGDEALAHKRGHSTMEDAARAAAQAGARRLIITHISQKYLRVAPFRRQVRTIFDNTEIASDLDRFEIHYVG